MFALLSPIVVAVLAFPLPEPQTYEPTWVANSGQPGSGFGGTLDLVGDVNNDGFDDAIVGAKWFGNGQIYEGKVFGYLGSPTGLSTTPHWTYESNLAYSNLGWSIAGAGDVNADGFDDVVVGHQKFANGQANEGAVLVFLGSSAGLPALPSATIEGNAVAASIGRSVARAGDVDNDGFADVIVGAPNTPNLGRVYVHRGTATGLSPTPATTLIAPTTLSSFGWTVTGLGDVDGDGYADIFVGAPTYSNGELGEGAGYMYRGSLSGTIATPAWSAESDIYNSGFGISATGGDFDADGFADLVVGVPWFGDDGLVLEGHVFVYRGSALGLSAQPTAAFGSQQANSWFGTAVANAGDVDGDGIDDLLVGAPGYGDSPELSAHGRLFVYRGSAGSGLGPIASWCSSPVASNPFLGMAVAGNGDVNGDGLADVIGGGEDEQTGTQFVQGFHGGALAAAVPYGAGKSLGAFIDALRIVSPQAPVLGANANLDIAGGASFGPAYLFAGSSPASLAFDGGTLEVVPNLVVALGPFDVAGQLTLPVALPLVPQLVGVSVYMQAMTVDPAAPGFYHSLQSNGLKWTFGV